MMGAVWMHARAELRRRWRALVLLALLVAIFSGATLASAAGARRTATSFDRLLDHLSSAEVTIGEDSALVPGVMARMSALPEVQAAGQAAFLLLPPEGLSVAGVNALAAADGSWGRDVDRLLVIEGRMPAAADEVALTAALADELGATVGEIVPYRGYAPDQIESIFAGESPAPAGPRFEQRVVGIVLHPIHLTVGSEPSRDSVFSQAFFELNRDRVLFFGPTLSLRLRDGLASLPAIRRAAAAITDELDGRVFEGIGEIVDDPEIGIQSTAERYTPARDAVRVQGFALWLFAGALGVATTLLLGQALARQTMLASGEAPVLSALGMDGPQRALTTMIPAMLSAAVGVVAGVGIAVVVSGIFPFGFARRAEPSVGLAADPAVLGLGAPGLLVLLTAFTAFASWRGARTRVPEDGSRGTHPSSVGRVVASSGMPASAAVGVRMALEPGRGRTAVPVRTALAGAIIGITGLVAALGAGASLDALKDDPRLYGQDWDAWISGGDDIDSVPRTTERVRALDAVSESSVAVLADVSVEGRRTQGVFVGRIEGDVSLSVVEGRSARAPDEVVLGLDTMRALDVRIGETARVASTGDTDPLSMTVVRRATFPGIDEDTLADGAAFDIASLEQLGVIVDYPVFLLRFAGGVDHGETIDDLKETFGVTNAGGVTRPGEVENLARVSSIPWILAGLILLLALATIGHALITTIRRRARDLAVLKTIGFIGRQMLGTIAWQASTFAIAAALVGVPLGIVAGRWSWIAIARPLGVPLQPVVPMLLVAVVIPVGLIIANLAVAISPARAAARTQPALVLRSE